MICIVSKRVPGMEKRNVPGVWFPKDLSCMQRVSFSFLNSGMDNESAAVANLLRKHIIFKLGHLFPPLPPWWILPLFCLNIPCSDMQAQEWRAAFLLVPLGVKMAFRLLMWRSQISWVPFLSLLTVNLRWLQSRFLAYRKDLEHLSSWAVSLDGLAGLYRVLCLYLELHPLFSDI